MVGFAELGWLVRTAGVLVAGNNLVFQIMMFLRFPYHRKIYNLTLTIEHCCGGVVEDGRPDDGV